MNNTEEKSLTIIKDRNIFKKFMNFFHNIFNKRKQTYEDIDSNSKIIPKRSFIDLDNMEMKFQNFKNGYIKEEDLTEKKK